MYTHITFVVDRSGSMAGTAKDAQDGINSLLTDQFSQGDRLTVTLVEFDDTIDTVKRMTAVPFDYQLKPRGSTALLDAVGSEIVQTGIDLSKIKKSLRPERVLFVIVTDGYENASKEYNKSMVSKSIAHQREVYNWEFSFIGAGESAWYGQEIGVWNNTTYVNTSSGVSNLYGSLNASITSYRNGGAYQLAKSVTE